MTIKKKIGSHLNAAGIWRVSILSVLLVRELDLDILVKKSLPGRLWVEPWNME